MNARYEGTVGAWCFSISGTIKVAPFDAMEAEQMSTHTLLNTRRTLDQVKSGGLKILSFHQKVCSGGL